MFIKLLIYLLVIILAFPVSGLARVVGFGEEEETDTESTKRLIDFQFEYNKL